MGEYSLETYQPFMIVKKY